MKNQFLVAAGIALSPCAMAQNADSATLYFQKAMVEKAANRYLVAAKYLDKAIGFNGQYAAAYEQNGYMNLAMHKTDAAMQHFTKLHRLEPDNKAAIQELAELYFSYHQYQKAIDFATMSPAYAPSARIIAMSSYHLEDYGTAIKGLMKVLEKEPQDAEANYFIARSYLDMELYTKAVPFYTRAIALNGTKNTWMQELGLLYYNLNDYKNAKFWLVKAKESGYPASNDFNENLGYACIYSGEFEMGENLLLAILAKKPGNKEILTNIAEAYYQQKRYDQSLEFCQRLMVLDAKDAKALYQAGLCFQKKGQKDKGQSMCDEAIKWDPSLKGLRQKMEQGM